MEAVSVLETKLYSPSKRSNFIHRQRLVDQLTEGSKRKFTVICAPAGYGKTTLLSDWIRSSGKPATWLSLDNDDNELSCFLTYIVAALQKLDPSIGLDIKEAIASSDQANIKTLLAKLIVEISGLAHDFILTLDDYHQISSKPVHEALEFILSHIPANMHLVVAGRAEPPLPLARFRVQEQMTEIRTSDLKFTEDETRSFLNSAMGLNLSTAEISALEARTEGWIASLQLAALSLRGHEDTKNFVDAFSGSHRYVLDYLIDEVLFCQTKEVKSFLVRTSILNRLCGPLCDHLLETTTSQRTLEQLDADNLFLVPLDDERRWFRYHHLFADLLSKQLLQEEPDIANGLHHRAAGWFMDNSLIPEAISHALAANDFDQAADFIESVSGGMVDQGRLTPVLNWTDRLPDQIISSHPRTALSRAWAYLLTGRLEKVQPLLKMIETRLSEGQWAGSPEAEEIVGSVKKINVFIASGTGDLHRDLDLALEAYQDLPQKDSSSRNALATNLGYLYLACGDLDSATSFLEEVHDRFLKQGAAAVTVTGYLGDVEFARGHLRQATRIYTKTLEAGTKQGSDQRVPASSHADIGLGEILYERNNLKEALRYLARGIETGQENSQAGIILKGNLALVKLHQAEGNTEEAYAALNRAKEVAPQAYRVREAGQITSWETRLWLTEGNLEVASKWADERLTSTKSELDYLNRIEHIMVARVLIARGDTGQAVELLTRLLESAKAGGHLRDSMEIMALKAVAEQASNRGEESSSTITEALDLAEPEGYVRSFIDIGESIEPLLNQMVSTGQHPQYVAKLLRAFESSKDTGLTKDKQRSPANQALFDPLSERELEVLALIKDRLKYIEIAKQLVVSINTVRTHAKNIYRKLGVNSRSEAINRADELNLV